MARPSLFGFATGVTCCGGRGRWGPGGGGGGWPAGRSSLCDRWANLRYPESLTAARIARRPSALGDLQNALGMLLVGIDARSHLVNH